MIDRLKLFYSDRIGKQKGELSKVQKKIYTLGTVRLVLALLVFLLFYLFWNQINGYVLAAVAAGLIVFFRLVLEGNNLTKQKEYLKAALLSDKNELKAITYDFSPYDGAPERINGEHPFTLDLDIFGNRSFFQSFNRTVTPSGKDILAGWMENPLSDEATILERQESVRELASNPALIHHFQVTGSLNASKQSDVDELRSITQQPTLFLQNPFWRLLRYLLPALWVLVIIFTWLGYFLPEFIGAFYIMALIVSESGVKKINFLQGWIGRKAKILETYSELFYIIENQDVKSSLLQQIRQVFILKGFTVSKEVQKLAQLSGELDQRSNMLVHILLNPLLLWDIRKAMAIDSWKVRNGEKLGQWLLALGTFDAFCSMGKFAYNHPDFVYPEISGSYFDMEGKSLGHPLMYRDTCIKNDIHFHATPYFMIVTGANMAGKSTYLRTIGINYLLACTGMPVCAESLRLYPARLYTSLRTSDSLADNESYFFAELKRLKAIIDELNSGNRLFIILDEILKGTNSIDKQKGSFALLRQLIDLKTCGIIATHDLALGELEQQYPEHVKNYHFDADIINNELHFSYQLRTGVARNMNACFLMNKMGIRFIE